MDRNLYSINNAFSKGVALRKESVDRNTSLGLAAAPTAQSLSARRAWIEIAAAKTAQSAAESLSARRAWIEIVIELSPWGAGGGRSPQGERG